MYGLRAHGPYAPEHGHRFNPHKLLLDPYAREIVGRFSWRDEHYAYSVGHPDDDRTPDLRDNGSTMLKARVAAPPAAASVARDRVRRALIDSVLYELHVKALRSSSTPCRPRCAAPTPGLRIRRRSRTCNALGVTTLSLLPVHYAIDEQPARRARPVNYWGYNTLGFFCARSAVVSHPRRSVRNARGVPHMVDALHAAGFEVVLDVVYNHTRRGRRGRADAELPRARQRELLPPRRRTRAARTTQAAATPSTCAHPRVLQLVLDSLRYWVARWASTGSASTSRPCSAAPITTSIRDAPFFFALAQDPVLRAREADRRALGSGPGRLPARPLSRAAGRMERSLPRRDAAFWLSRGVDRGEFARRLAASSDKFHHGPRCRARRSTSSPSHDGFTLADLVSYTTAQPGQRREQPRRPQRTTSVRNCGVEGPTTDAEVLAQRGRCAARAARHARVRARHADACGRRRARPHAARQQQRLLPGQRRPAGSTGRTPTRA